MMGFTVVPGMTGGLVDLIPTLCSSLVLPQALVRILRNSLGLLSLLGERPRTQVYQLPVRLLLVVHPPPHLEPFPCIGQRQETERVEALRPEEAGEPLDAGFVYRLTYRFLAYRSGPMVTTRPGGGG